MYHFIGNIIMPTRKLCFLGVAFLIENCSVLVMQVMLLPQPIIFHTSFYINPIPTKRKTNVWPMDSIGQFGLIPYVLQCSLMHDCNMKQQPTNWYGFILVLKHKLTINQ